MAARLIREAYPVCVDDEKGAVGVAVRERGQHSDAGDVVQVDRAHTGQGQVSRPSAVAATPSPSTAKGG